MADTAKTGAIFRSAVVIVMLIVLLAGLARLLLDSHGADAVKASLANTWAECLAKVAIPQKTALTITSLIDKYDKPLIADAATKLEYWSPTTPMKLDPVEPSLRIKLSGKDPLIFPKGTELRVKEGEFSLKGYAEAQVGDAALLIRGPERLVFGPAADTTYIIKLTKDLQVRPPFENQGDAAKLPPATEGYLEFGVGKTVSLLTLDAFKAAPLLLHNTQILLPVRAFGEKGPNALAIETRQQGLEAKNLTACAVSQGIPYSVGVSDVATTSEDKKNIIFNVPSNVLPDLSLWPTPVTLAVATTDGSYIAHGSFVVFGRAIAALIATVLTGLLFWALLHVRHMATVPDEKARKQDWSNFFAGLFITEGDNDPSLSLFQVFFWTVITIWGFLYTFAVTGSLLQMTPQMMVLLGIAGTGSVLARWIAVSRGGSTSQAAQPGDGAAKQDGALIKPVDFWRILDTNGQFDMLKLQLLLFTLLIGVYVICRIADAASFPVLDPNTLLLLGVSQGIYIGGKLGGTTPLARAQAIMLELGLATEATTKLPDEIKKAETERDALKEEIKPLNAEIEVLNANPNRTNEQTTRLSDLQLQVKNKKNQIDAKVDLINQNNADLSLANANVAKLKPSLNKAVEELKLPSTS